MRVPRVARTVLDRVFCFSKLEIDKDALRHVRILTVDDDEDALDLLLNLIECSGGDGVTARTSAEELEAVHDGQIQVGAIACYGPIEARARGARSADL